MLLKSEDKQRLYYNKYRYKTTVKAPNLYWIQECKTFADFNKKFDSVRSTNNTLKQSRSMTIRELDLVKNIIEFRNEIAKTADWTTRQESDGLTFYNNDLDFLKRVWKFSPKSTIFEVQVMPPGTITFARQPKHQYRVYLSGSRIEKESRDDLRDYLSRTPKAEPCGALKTWLSYDYKRLWLYSNEKHFIDYDEPAILTMLHLICPKLIGKSYKLERK